MTQSTTHMQPNDSPSLDALIPRIAHGDAQALAELYQQTSARVYAYVLSVLKNPHDAQDVLHDCYIRVYAAAGGYQHRGKPLAWILTIARNLCLDLVRQRGRDADLPPEEWDRFFASQHDMTSDDRLVLEQCLCVLSAQEREIVLLHVVGGMKHRETADILDAPLATVLSRYSRALHKLKKQLYH